MLNLEKPRLDLFSSYMQFMSEMERTGEKIWDSCVPRGTENPQTFISRLLEAETKPEVGVPETTYWATINNEVVGRISIRHFLNENLKEFGGHIGYDVRPSNRSKGIAKEMLKQILQTPLAKSIGRILLTCSPDNIASNKTIIANGGELTETKFVERINRKTNYYWIDLQK